jgi:hypothetical protein
MVLRRVKKRGALRWVFFGRITTHNPQRENSRATASRLTATVISTGTGHRGRAATLSIACETVRTLTRFITRFPQAFGFRQLCMQYFVGQTR